MNTVYLLLGSNLGDRRHMLERAVKSIGQTGDVIRRSSLYETDAWGKTDQPAFLNQAVELQTSLAPDKLMQALLRIEKDLGRERGEKYGPRTVDIDILLYDDAVLKTDRVTIPHPAMQDRRFVLVPLAEIAADVTHPVSGKTIATLLAQCSDPLAVKIYT